MPKIYSYKKVTDLFTTHALLEPEIADNAAKVMELVTIDGTTYILVPDGVVLPVQSDQVQASLRQAILTPELIEQIKATSPYIKLITKRKLGEATPVKYSEQDENQIASLVEIGLL